MHWTFRTRFFVISLLALSLSGCFMTTVQHSAVKDGHIIGGPIDSYNKSQDTPIIVQQEQEGIYPKVYLQLIADSDHELDTIKFSIEKSEQQDGIYQKTEGSKSAMTDVGGQTVWAKRIELAEYGGNPIILDLSKTSLQYPLKLTVEAKERSGNTIVIKAMYLWWPKVPTPIGDGR